MLDQEFLQAHGLFGGLSSEQMHRIIPLLQHERFPAGSVIVNEGDRGDRLYFICAGAVEVLKELDTAEGRRQEQLAVLEVGESFGEMQLIDIQPRSATVTALEDVETVSLSNAALQELHDRDLPTFTMIIMNMARAISRRLRKTDALLASSVYHGSSGS